MRSPHCLASGSPKPFSSAESLVQERPRPQEGPPVPCRGRRQRFWDRGAFAKCQSNLRGVRECEDVAEQQLKPLRKVFGNTVPPEHDENIRMHDRELLAGENASHQYWRRGTVLPYFLPGPCRSKFHDAKEAAAGWRAKVPWTSTT